MGDGFRFARTELEEITAKIIQRDNLTTAEAYDRNKEGWQIPGAGSYTLSKEHIDAALLTARGGELDHPEQDNLPLDTRLVDVGHSLINKASLYVREPITYAQAEAVNESLQGWTITTSDQSEVEAAIRFSPEMLLAAWDKNRQDRIERDLSELTSQILVKEHSQNLPRGTSENPYPQEDHYKEIAGRINQEEGWVRAGGSYRLSETGINRAASDAQYRIVEGKQGRGPEPSENERLTRIGVVLMEGRHLSLEEAREQNRAGFQVENVGAIRLAEPTLKEAWREAYVRERSHHSAEKLVWKASSRWQEFNSRDGAGQSHKHEVSPRQAPVVAVSASRGDDWSR